jgi:DNA-binding MarR family transcriptional regulator
MVPRELPQSLCLSGALRRASRAVSRIYDEEFREVGLKSTQYSLLVSLSRVGEVRQGDLGELTCLEETTLTRNLRLLISAGWVDVRAGKDRREKWIRTTAAGNEILAKARPAWLRAQERLKQALPEGVWQSIMTTLPVVTQAAAKG